MTERPTGQATRRMKTIGLIGGMSWESSAEYYRVLNELVKARCGGLHSAECVLYSVDFAPIEAMQHAGAWDEAGSALADAARKVEHGGADFVLLCTNTMHKVADALTAVLTVPLIHIADPLPRQSRRRESARLACSARASRWKKIFTVGDSPTVLASAC